MNRKAQLLVLSVLMFGVQAASAGTFPADAEASYDLPALQTHAEKYGESSAWGVSERQPVQSHDAFPFGGGPVSD